jgi:hypothetical protein
MKWTNGWPTRKMMRKSIINNNSKVMGYQRHRQVATLCITSWRRRREAPGEAATVLPPESQDRFIFFRYFCRHHLFVSSA